MRVLITGGCGFVGSRTALYLKEKYPEYEIVAFDNLYRKGSELNVPILEDAGIQFLKRDVRNLEDFEGIGFDILVEASAEPSVMAGLGDDVKYLMDTNFGGLLNSVLACLKNNAKLIFISTSRVFPMEFINSLEYVETDTRYKLKSSGDGCSDKGFDEGMSKNGAKSLYGMSKFSSELLIEEYVNLSGLEAVINRCGLIAGKGQFGKSDQGVITHWAASYVYDRPLKIFGNGKQVRDVLNVSDFAKLVDMQIHDFSKFSGKTFNVGGGLSNSLSITELDMLCKKLCGEKSVPFEDERSLDIKYYVSDNSLIESFGWRAEISAEETLSEIIHWLKSNKEELRWIFA